MNPHQTEDWFPTARLPAGTQLINDRCLLRTQDGHRVVIAAGVPLAQYTVGDRMAEAFAMVTLVEQGWAYQNEVARAFGCSVRTVRRHGRRFEDGGLVALGHENGYPSGRRRLQGARTALVQRLKSEGHSNGEIARRIGVSETAVRKLLHRLGWKEAPGPIQLPLDPATGASSTPPPLEADSPQPPTSNQRDANSSSSPSAAATIAHPRSLDTDPMNRQVDRLMARLGLLDDAPPLFGSSRNVARAGVLLALPALIASGVFECAQKIYGSIGPSFYGLRTSLLTLLLMALWSLTRPEALTEHSPQDLGRVLGLDRAPEVKTLRRKLAHLAAGQHARAAGSPEFRKFQGASHRGSEAIPGRR